MFCNHCGAPNGDTAKFCSNCGNPVVAMGEPVAVKTALTMPQGHINPAQFPPYVMDKLRALGCNPEYVFGQLDKLRSFMAIDTKNKRIAFGNLHKKRKYTGCDFAELVGYDIKEDNVTVIKGNTGATIAGGLMFGTIGAIVGSNSAKTSKDMVNGIDMSIDLGPNKSGFLEFLSSPTPIGSDYHKRVIKMVEETAQALEYVLANK